MSTYQWANVALMGMVMQGVWIVRTHGKDIDTLLISLGIAVMAAGVVQALRGMQKQIDELKSISGNPAAEDDAKQKD